MTGPIRLTPPGAPAPDGEGLLGQIVELSSTERDIRLLAGSVASLVVRATQADACFVHVVDHERGELTLVGATPERFAGLAGTIRLKLGDGIAGWVARTGEAALVDDKWADPRYRYIPALRGEDFASLVSVPMRRPQGLVVGVLNVHSRRARYFGAGDVERLARVADLVAGMVDNAVLYEKLTVREHELERFAARTIELQELDRRRIAADIHDGVSQRLVSAGYYLTAASDRAGAGNSEQISAAARLIRDALDETRKAIAGLRPTILDDLGLPAAISSVAADLGADLTVEAQLDDCRLAGHVEIALYRIAQEALQNVAKHARASRAQVRLRRLEESVLFEVSDDGVGFDLDAQLRSECYGLANLAERAALLGARFEVRSAAGCGTTVIVEVPLRSC